MLDKIKESGRKFKESPAGKHFQNRYHRRQQESRGRWDAKKIALVGLVVAAGVCF